MMFNFMNGNRGNKCRVCRGRGTLVVVAFDADGRTRRHLPEIECDACDGTGRVMTAVEAYERSSQKQQ